MSLHCACLTVAGSGFQLTLKGGWGVDIKESENKSGERQMGEEQGSRDKEEEGRGKGKWEKEVRCKMCGEGESEEKREEDFLGFSYIRPH